MYKNKIKSILVNLFMSYDKLQFNYALAQLGLRPADNVMIHASWQSLNGFKGRPVDMINTLKQLVGSSGLLVMPSLTYQNESTREYLLRKKSMNIRRTPSMVGLLSEVFRRGKDVKRSLSSTHSLVAWGDKKNDFVADHEGCLVPFGIGSPFNKLLELNGKILTIDAPFSTITFTHFLEDRISPVLAFPLYDDEPMIGKVIDYEGVLHEIPVKVLAKQANALRREQVLIDELNKQGIIHRKKVGNTQLMLIDCKTMTECVDEMVRKGNLFFDSTMV